jgi:hypothetical protein
MTVSPSDPLRRSTPDAAAALAAVERATAGLDGLADRPLADHVAVFERIHAALGDALAAAPAAGEASGRA